ncbi:MAG TPA: magnesium transporter [Candidatus Limnocylindria bacterium]|nr:magnesium transporter [Candidatus Limnocylindria bacterium]
MATEPAPSDALHAVELKEAWDVLSVDERLEGLRLLGVAELEEIFRGVPAHDQMELLLAAPRHEARAWMRLLPPDDAADVIQQADPGDRSTLLDLLDDVGRKEVVGLLAYAEDDAGGLMNPRYARLRPEMRVDEAISYIRRQTREQVETVYYLYVLDQQQRLLGVVSFRDLLMAPPHRTVRDVMQTDVVTVHEEMDQEAVSALFAEHDFLAVPVVDDDGRMKGIVTIDDIVDVVREEATEDLQKLGGMTALETPYLETPLRDMLRKRGGWLAMLFLGEMFTATAMAYFEHEIARAVVLALFIPLIISSGGNAGSQASTLVVRALSLGELGVRDWWRVAGREILSGLALGAVLGLIGFVRISVWQAAFQLYGAEWFPLALTVAASLVGVVAWGSLAGSMLPLLLKGLGFDPAVASAPLVATLVDVSGIVIYFATASMILFG